MHRFPKPDRTIARFNRNAVAGEAHRTENGSGYLESKTGKRGCREPKSAPNGPISLRDPRRMAGCGLDVQQVLAGELRLVGNEGKARFGPGAHQPLDGIGGALA